MEKRRRVLMALLAIAFISGFAVAVLRLGEPVYQGRRLSWWLEDLSRPSEDGRYQHAAEAVRQIGSNAVPTLVKIMGAKESPLQHKLRRLMAKQRLVHFRFQSVSIRRQEATIAFKILGSDARAAVPALVDLLGDQDQIVRFQAEEALANIGVAASNAVPALIQCSRNPDYLVRSKAVEALGDIGPAATAAVEPLTKLLTDKDQSVREAATNALKQINP